MLFILRVFRYNSTFFCEYFCKYLYYISRIYCNLRNSAFGCKVNFNIYIHTYIHRKLNNYLSRQRFYVQLFAWFRWRDVVINKLLLSCDLLASCQFSKPESLTILFNIFRSEFTPSGEHLYHCCSLHVSELRSLHSSRTEIRLPTFQLVYEHDRPSNC